MALKIGTKVKIINVPPKYAKPNCTNIDGSIGIIEKYYPDQKQYAVSIQGAWNEASSNGLYWLHSDSIEVIDKNGGINIMGNKLTGYKYVAIVNLVDDINAKDYGFAVYDEDMDFFNRIPFDYDTPAYLIVNARDNYSLAKLKRIVCIEEYSKDCTAPVTKEVICFCDATNYNNRIKQRKEEAERKIKETKLRSELDERIAKLKDMDYYKRMADELGSRDSELKSLVDELVKVAGE